MICLYIRLHQADMLSDATNMPESSRANTERRHASRSFKV